MRNSARCILSAFLAYSLLAAGPAVAADPNKIPQAVSVTCSLGSLEDWNIKRLADCHSMKIFEFPAGSGSFVGRFEIKPDDPRISSGWRAEVKAWKRECGILTRDQVPWTEFINYKGAIGYRNVIGYYFKAGVYTVHPFDSPMSVYHTAFGRGATPESIGINQLHKIYPLLSQ